MAVGAVRLRLAISFTCQREESTPPYDRGMSEGSGRIARLDTQAIPRVGRGTQPEAGVSSGQPLSWEVVQDQLARGGWYWLSSADPGGAPHVTPVFAVWCDDAACVASNPSTRKSRNLLARPACALAADKGNLHLVIEGRARRLVDAAALQRVTDAFRTTYGWPTEVAGELLDAPYGAPTSRGGPFFVFAIDPTVAYGFPSDDSFEPTRWRFPEADRRK